MSSRNHNCTRCEKNKARRFGLCEGCAKEVPANVLTPEQKLEADRTRAKQAQEITELRLKYGAALKTIERQEAALGAISVLQENADPYDIEPREGSGTSEATPVLLASDWHIEEEVGAEVNGLNRYNLDIAKDSAEVFFTSSLRLIRLLNQDVAIHNVVVGLLGDFITNDIHGAENAEKNLLQPNHAIVFVQNLLISGIDFLLNMSDYDFTFICKVGNHGRTTQTTRFSSENGHSLEYLMYLHLAAYYRTEPRVRFVVDDGYHTYIDIYDMTLRFHHGHAVKYGGGVGGIYIPVNKAMAQWDKAMVADLDVFGHFHQLRDGGGFICNGSMIGYNAFAQAIKADYEPPKQALFLLDKKRGRTCTWPILFNPR